MDYDHQEVIVASTSTEQNIGVWDVHTGTLLTNYKGNACGRNALSLLGSDYFVAAQSGKGLALHFWSWNKDQVHQRSFTSQQIVSIACTPCGVYCAAGSTKGTVFIWETASGKLLRYWSAHYKQDLKKVVLRGIDQTGAWNPAHDLAVNDLAFTKDSRFLVSGGEDATVSAWLLMDVLDMDRLSQQVSQTPFASWSQHMLPVTSILVGDGAGETFILSVSLDKTCKVWSLENGNLLSRIAAPTSLHSLALDGWQSCVFLGGGDGQIFQAGLHGQRLEAPPSTSNASVPTALQESGIQVLSGHTRCVNSLACTQDSFHLVSGSEEGVIKVWDIQSRQCLRNLTAKGPVSNIIIINKPLLLTQGRGRGRKQRKRQQPLAVFGKQVEFAGNVVGSCEGWEPPPVVLNGFHPYRGVVQEAGLLSSKGLTDDESASARQEVEDTENLKLKEQIESAKKTISDLRSTNAKLHAFVVQTSGKQ